MEYRAQSLSPAPASALSLFARLNEAGVRYGIFKSSRNTLMGVAGDQDLDVLVAREDYRLFSAIALDCMGIRSVNHASLVSPGREDWFIPDFERARYLHLDVHTSVLLGGKFNKRYPSYRYQDIGRWEAVTVEGCAIPVASPEDEATITLSRIAFRAGGPLRGAWCRLTGDWAQEIDELLFRGVAAARDAVQHDCAPLNVGCQVSKRADGIRVRSEDMARIRRLVRSRCGASFHSALADAIVNRLRAWRYIASRIVNRLAPGHIIDRRRPAGGGLVVAVMAPDGLGKSTQVDRMYRLFNWKFSCAKLYLGTGDGQGWWLRRRIRSMYMRRRSRIDVALGERTSRPGSSGFRSAVTAFLLSAWGVLAALERHGRIRAARRMADRGFIVLCDRWPQSLQAGLMDGPTRLRTPAPPRRLRRWELALYDRMSRIQPDLVVHLVGDYAVSQARKPGEISRDEFEKRIAVMAALRAGAPRIHVIDAGGSIEDVSKSLFGLIWKAL